nr:fanconi anemia group J protein [Halisarca dujardinii]
MSDSCKPFAKSEQKEQLQERKPELSDSAAKGASAVDPVKEEGEGPGGESAEVGTEQGRKRVQEVEDFVPAKKKFRHPAVGTRGKKKKLKGIKYDGEDLMETQSVDHTLQPNTQGLPQWRMEMKAKTAALSGACSCLPLSPPPTDNGPKVKPEVVCTLCDCHSREKEASLKQETAAGEGGEGAPSGGKDRSARPALPKIYFATRTHKQIRQIVHEMKRTAYKDVPMSILASKEHYCVHPEVSKKANKSDECKKLLDYSAASCAFFTLYKRLGTQASLKAAGLSEAWDVEELVGVGKRNKACPYFVSRSLMEEADIIFCPYNYIVDPAIRLSMSLSVENDVVIFDEGHNMEDAAREAASYSVTTFELLDVLADIDRVKTLLKDAEKVGGFQKHPQFAQLQSNYGVLRAMVHSVSKWTSMQIPRLPHRGYEQSHQIWYGIEMMKKMETEMGINPHTFKVYKGALDSVMSSKLDVQEDRRLANFFSGEFPTLLTAMSKIIEHLLFVMGFMFLDNCKYAGDYRVALSTVTVNRPKGGQVSKAWFPQRSRSKATERVMGHQLSFWCMNPAVAFSDLSSARSLILTSGTLSPMRSFTSELGVPFAHQLEANHVVQPEQVLVQSVSHGPRGKLLLASYQHTESLEFQDDLGLLLAEVCETVPHGVLCFLSSYKMMDKLSQRWKTTDLFARLERCKTVLMEPRASEKSEFDSVIQQFYAAAGNRQEVEQEEDGEEDGGGFDWNTSNSSKSTGALFLAVCRGKVSEGLDFADDHARAVITVGIPFPNVRDKQVELKREYNDEHSRSRGLLPGGDWYEIQAFRAVNQALGRCIRHRNDWGCLILVDDRFGKGGKYTNGLSKWVRRSLHHENEFRHTLGYIQRFIAARTAPAPAVLGEGEPPAAAAVDSTLVVMDTSLALKSDSSQSPPLVQASAIQTPFQTSIIQTSVQTSTIQTPVQTSTIQMKAALAPTVKTSPGCMLPPIQLFPAQTSVPGVSPAQTSAGQSSRPRTRPSDMSIMDFAASVKAETEKGVALMPLKGPARGPPSPFLGAPPSPVLLKQNCSAVCCPSASSSSSTFPAVLPPCEESPLLFGYPPFVPEAPSSSPRLPTLSSAGGQGRSPVALSPPPHLGGGSQVDGASERAPELEPPPTVSSPHLRPPSGRNAALDLDHGERAQVAWSASQQRKCTFGTTGGKSEPRAGFDSGGRGGDIGAGDLGLEDKCLVDLLDRSSSCHEGDVLDLTVDDDEGNGQWSNGNHLKDAKSLDIPTAAGTVFENKKEAEEGEGSVSVRTRRKNVRHAKRSVPEFKARPGRNGSTSCPSSVVCSSCQALLCSAKNPGQRMTVAECLKPVFGDSLHSSTVFSGKAQQPVTVVTSQSFRKDSTDTDRRCGGPIAWDGSLGLCVRSVECRGCGQPCGVEVLAANQKLALQKFVNHVFIW